MKRYIKSSSIYDEIADKYNLIKISDTEWQVPESGVIIKKTFDDFGREEYRIYYSNGNYITYVNSFRLAAILATSYCY
jgi:hypothetical protein